jgi:hypothetical protein
MVTVCAVFYLAFHMICTCFMSGTNHTFCEFIWTVMSGTAEYMHGPSNVCTTQPEGNSVE